MKKHILGSFLLGFAAVGVLGTTTAFAAGTTGTGTTDNSQLSATTKGSINFTPGTISLYGVQDSVAFKSSNVGDVYANGLDATADPNLTATVADFLGAEKDTWTLTLAQSGWKSDTSSESSSEGADALNTGTLSTTDDGNNTQVIDTTGTTYKTGSAGITVLKPQTLKLHLDKGTNVKAGNYTNNLTWNLTDPAIPTQQ